MKNTEAKLKRELKWKKEKKQLLIAGALAIVLTACFGVSRVVASEPVTTVNISEGTSAIPKYQYYSSSKLQSVTTPSSLQTIGFSAFDGCTSLTSVNLSEGLLSLDNRSFAKCSSLTNISVPETVNSIGNAVFYDCVSLSLVKLPTSLTKLENNLFYNCKSLKNLIIPSRVVEVGQQCFYGCSSLSDLTLPTGVKRIDDGAFYECSNLTKLTVPDSVTSIGTDAFYGCPNLTIVCNAGSYVEKYAKSAGIRVETHEISQIAKADDLNTSIVASEITNLEDVPKTGIKLPYLTCSILLFMAVALLYYLKGYEFVEK